MTNKSRLRKNIGLALDLIDKVFGDMVVMRAQLQSGFVSLDTFRERQEQKNEEMTECLTSLEY